MLAIDHFNHRFQPFVVFVAGCRRNNHQHLAIRADFQGRLWIDVELVEHGLVEDERPTVAMFCEFCIITSAFARTTNPGSMFMV